MGNPDETICEALKKRSRALPMVPRRCINHFLAPPSSRTTPLRAFGDGYSGTACKEGLDQRNKRPAQRLSHPAPLAQFLTFRRPSLHKGNLCVRRRGAKYLARIRMKLNSMQIAPGIHG